jgi:uncharacterized LabA/DUF88 family protein
VAGVTTGGWRPDHIPITGGGRALTDTDFKPIFEQKGVDMRVGLDIATISIQKAAERIMLVSADTDMVPAMKQARKSGLEVILAQLPPPAHTVHKSLAAHCDLVRSTPWP